MRALQDVLLPETDQAVRDIESHLEELERDEALWCGTVAAACKRSKLSPPRTPRKSKIRSLTTKDTKDTKEIHEKDQSRVTSHQSRHFEPPRRQDAKEGLEHNKMAEPRRTPRTQRKNNLNAES